MDPRELLLTAARAFGIYLFMLVVVRILGKRTIGNFAAFDLLVALMLGELVDEIIYGDVSLVQGTLAIVVIAGAQAGNSWLTRWGHGFDTLLEGKPTVIVRDGTLQSQGLRAERMNAKEVMGHLRSLGIQDVRLDGSAGGAVYRCRDDAGADEIADDVASGWHIKVTEARLAFGNRGLVHTLIRASSSYE